MNRVVMKYGGTSVKNIDNIKKVAKIIAKRKEQGKNVVVVVSAMGNTTDNLIDMAKQISKDKMNTRELDMLISTGEQQSIALLSMAIEAEGYKAISLTGFQADIKTTGVHTKNTIKDINTAKLEKYLDQGCIVVVAGFQGVNESGDITTLGRGGSDTTAVALAAMLDCSCEIYTDVDGVYTIDPRVYKNARKLDVISYEEMMQMSSLGAGVLETRAVQLGKQYGVPIMVALNTGMIRGTYIKELKKMEERGVTGLSMAKGVLMITVDNINYSPVDISHLFKLLATEKVNIDMISQNSQKDGLVSVSFTADDEDKYIVEKVLNKYCAEIKSAEYTIEEDIVKISLVGMGMMNQSGVASRIFGVYADSNIDFKLVTTSEISVSYAINKKDTMTIVNNLAREFNL
ncbi:aspartate kinase [Clostridiaceae bacterium M8S5]|nr:aspartate kinase [Clostridiaceae bacterium M8S5]